MIIRSGKEEMKMRKFFSLIVVLSLVTFSSTVAAVRASESISKGWDRPYQVSDILGSVVMNHQGQYLGRVQGFVFDPDGHIVFGIIGNARFGSWRIIGENSVAVPFNALIYDRSGRRPMVMVDMSWEKYQSAPGFSKADLTNQQRVGEIYRYFGLQPYWTK
ncbi:MAG: PRC-barrel domain containing protein [Deltaproteobacteria bacterium]|nr:MAG: PRC-barrel domain containing protein [Deltaproteobacteria bacterium]